MSRLYEVQFGSAILEKQPSRGGLPAPARWAVVLVAIAMGCGGGGGAAGGGRGPRAVDPETGQTVTTAAGQAVSAEAHSHWQEGLQAFAAAERAGWNEERCDAVGEHFEEANSAQGGRFAEALYMSGLTHQRCRENNEAQAFFNRALQANERMCAARVSVGLAHLDANRDAEARQAFERAIRDDNQCTEAYVNLAVIQRQAGGAQVREALNNLRRALAIDSNYLPAFNQMALLYVDQAGENPQMLDLAAVVCRQAQQINRDYAPIYNTWGLINMKKNDIIQATAMFERAFSLDNTMFEAYLNFAQIVLGFRGYEDGERACRRAVELRPRNYDAHICLGMALRGLGRPEQAMEQYNAAKELDAQRAEAYFNIALIHHDYSGGSREDLLRARSVYQEFLQRAGNNQRYRDAVEQVNHRCRRLSQSQRRRRRTSRIYPPDCRPGRLQLIEDSLEALQMAQQMQAEADRIQRQAEEQERQRQQQEQQQPQQPAPNP